jgi:hydroxymethylpyrimidine pyrophosphatase-like HAD family hydrolase
MMSQGMTRSLEWARAVALDFDDTLAEDGVVEPAVLDGLKRLKASGRRLVLVTGREIDDLVRTFPALAVFDRVVGENGAVLYRPETGDSVAIATPPRDEFIARLRREHVSPLSVGQVIVATRAPHETRVADAIRALDLDLAVIRNKGAVMVLPRGINKGTGLREALGQLQISPQDVIGVGDAENDFDLLDACGCGVAVANALPALAQRADIVTRSPGGRGVLELIAGLFPSGPGTHLAL